MRSHLGGCRSDGKLRVRADADQLEDVGILLAVDQDEIGPQVAVAAVAVLALHGMVQVTGRERHVGGEQFENFEQGRIQVAAMGGLA